MTTPPDRRGRRRREPDPERGASRSPSPPPEEYQSDTWYNAAYNMVHQIRGSQLLTSTLDSAGQMGRWAVERTPAVVDTAVDSLEYAGLALQAVGTARNDSDQGWASTYNWGVALTGAAGLRTVFLEGRRVLQPHPSDPPNIFAATLGAGRAAGASMYGLADESRVRSAGAGLQTVASLGEYARNRYIANQTRAADAERARRAEERAAEPAPQLERPSFGDPFDGSYEMSGRERASGSDRGRGRGRGRGSGESELRRRNSSRAPEERERRRSRAPEEGERRRRDSSAAPQERPRAVRPPRENRDRRPPPSWDGTLPQSAAPRSMSGSSSSSEERRSRRDSSRAPRDSSRAPRDSSRAPGSERRERRSSRAPEARPTRPEPVADPTMSLPVRSREPVREGSSRNSDDRQGLRRSNTSSMSSYGNNQDNTTRRRGGGQGRSK